MTREEILALPAGPCLDRLIACRVMEWTFPACKEKFPDVNEWYLCGDGEEEAVAPESGWKPSLDIAAAWTVIEKLKQAGSSIYLWCGFSGVNSVWTAKIDNWGVTSDSAPLAICRAALLAQSEQAS